MTTLYAFIDTNVVLQCRRLDELPWEACTEVMPREIVVGVPFLMLRELCRLKGRCDARRAQQARSSLSRFRDAFVAGTDVQPPRGTTAPAPSIRGYRRPAIDWSSLPRLDP